MAELLKGAFTPIDIDREGALRSIERIGAATHLVSAAEYLARKREFEPGSLGDWDLVQERFAHLRPWQQRILAVASRSRVAKALHVGRIVASATLMARTHPTLRAAANGYLALSTAALYPRGNYGGDGSDQVSFQTAAATFVARTAPTAGVQDAAIWYVGLQSALSYAVSGWVKLFGRSWRTGTAIPGVMRTRAYGNKRVWKMLKDRPRLASLSAHGMLAFEALFPLVFVARGRLTRPFVAAAVGFHSIIAGSMGLGRFLTAFGSMLPAVAYTTNRRPKSNLVPALAVTSIAAAIAGGAVASHFRRARIRNQTDQVNVVTCSSGNVLHYRREQHRAGAPILILEHGMLATPQHLALVADRLSAKLSVITYWRAGYGPSENNADGYTTDDRAEDLVDLIESLPEDGASLYLGGHSLGGLVARSAAQISERLISGLVYLDSSHPGQLVISSGQRRGADGLSSALAFVPASLCAGLGWLLPKPAWIDFLPERARRESLDQYRDSRLWKAGTREWQDARRAFGRRHSVGLDTIDIPALVITAEQTLRVDRAQELLHEDLANSHNGRANRVVIREADHDSILTHPAHATTTSEAILNFVDQIEVSK